MFCGNREGISDLPCSTLVSVDIQCSIALLSIIIIRTYDNPPREFYPKHHQGCECIDPAVRISRTDV